MGHMFATPLVVLSLCFAICFSAPDALADESSPKRIFKFGVITLNHPLVIYQQYQPFLDYLSERQPWRYDLVLEQRYSAIVDRLQAGTLDIALLAGRTFLQARERTPLDPICAVTGVDGTPTIRSLIVVRDDRKDIRTVADLTDKRFAFGSPDSTASYLVPLDYLKQHGITLASFSRWDNLGTHDAVARAVLRGEYDAGAVGEPMAMRYLGSGLRMLAATPPFPGFIIVARAAVPEPVREALRRTLLAIDPASPEVTARSTGWNEVLRHGFVTVDTSVYEAFRAMETRMGLSPQEQTGTEEKP
ncbi:phosphate/phosphite/phosphonate ABC transporter substrate-binding protein [Desulfovibrio oxamicus]|uniref:Phosphate/phosphite/phosphonate ABC transporter substrate-binding protein n=1 Tax=Nitratidesulfovibrio oxamicus TaxID=32016 RepID=A0ABS0J8N1_9BACT|nr:phosphate/phosphite/phosphonate ABC transporter substrate-binding protein [Nitratidesulfovibrio oxamicus]MBG3878793.1 phosphate/phosphite/phosphonate ABC transporter substrate-binding protein [Nitratidesulfovibrio oxamicus]